MLQPLNFVSLNHRSVYLAVLREFNHAEIVGSMNRSRTYRIFLDKYLKVISYLGYTYIRECEYIRYMDGEYKEEIDRLVFDEIENRLKNLRERLDFSAEITADIDTIIEFIEKNRELYKTNLSAIAEPVYPHVEIKEGRGYLHEDTMKKLQQECPDLASLQTVMIEAYNAEKLFPYEMEAMIKKFGSRGDNHGKQGQSV